MDHKAAFPLGAGDKDGTDAAFGRDVALDAFDMGLLTGEGDAGACIDAPLEHLEAIVLEPFAEIVRGLSLWLAADGQVEGDDQPTHFELFGVHGL